MITQSDVPRWLKVTEVAARLSLHRSTVYRMIQTGELPSVRLRGNVRVPSRMLDDWMREHEDMLASGVYTPRHE